MTNPNFFITTSGDLESKVSLWKKKPLCIRALQMNETFQVATLEGIMTGKAGDYLVIGIKDELYPVDREIFEASYVSTDSPEGKQDDLFQAIAEERRLQNQQWGGARHDDKHSLYDWLGFIQKQFFQAIGEHFAGISARGRLIKIAALCVAAVESLDRNCSAFNKYLRTLPMVAPTTNREGKAGE